MNNYIEDSDEGRRTRLSRRVISVRRAGPSATGDKREEVERRAGRKNALLERKDMIVVGSRSGGGVQLAVCQTRSVRGGCFRGLISNHCFRGPIGTIPVLCPTMSALRLVSAVARRAPGSFVLGRRGYAEAADKIKLSLVLPHQVRLHTFTEPAELSVTPMRGRRSSPLQTLCRSTCLQPPVTWVFSLITFRLLNRSGLAS